MKKSREDKYKPHKKPVFYADEDFPPASLKLLRDFKVKHSIIDFDYSGRDDEFHFKFAANQKLIMLTLDDDYLDNKKFKLIKTYGVIVIKVGRLSVPERVNQVLQRLIPHLKKIDSNTLKGVKIRASKERYTKISLKEGRVQKEEFSWGEL